MRSHPIVGSLFLLVGLALFGLGATSRSAPGFLRGLPVPPEVVVPFVLWQLAVWSLLFAFFFLRPRGQRQSGVSRTLPRV